MKGLLDDDEVPETSQKQQKSDAHQTSGGGQSEENQDTDFVKTKLLETLAGSRAGELLEGSLHQEAASTNPRSAPSSQAEPQEMFTDELNLQGKIEALLFASPSPLRASDLFELLYDENTSLRDINSTAEQMVRFYQEKTGGFKLVHIQGKGYQFQTVPMASYLMERMFSQRPRPLSRAAHETLAIIAYRQPVTRADIEFIRGVDAGSIIKNLLERNLIRCAGRKETSPGKPMVFGTTDEFLKTYRINSLSALPPLESFQPSREAMNQAKEKIESKSDIKLEELIPPPAHDNPLPLNSEGGRQDIEL